MRTALQDLLADAAAVLADGATGANYFELGLTSGAALELWNVTHPELVSSLRQSFVSAGADIILTDTFGFNATKHPAAT